jgi:hypothetical protein
MRLSTLCGLHRDTEHVEMVTSFLELLGDFPYRELPPLYFWKSARFLGQCTQLDLSQLAH